MLNRKKGTLISSLLLLSAFVFIGQVQYGFAADVTLAWDPITQAELAGYKVYVGTSSRNYGTGIDVGKVTSYTVTALGPGTYYFAATAYDVTGRETGYSNEVSETILSSDTTPPAVSITSPASSPTYTTGSSSLGIGGSASDNVAVTQVTWANNRGGSGTATGTSSWSVTGITLLSGVNVITVTARDAAGNTATATLTVTYAPSDTTPPVISNVSASGVTATSANISWTTDKASDSQVEYGTSISYGNLTTLNPGMLSSHTQGLSGLTQGTLYHYRVRSKDAAGNLAVSGDFVFTTLTSCSYSLSPNSASVAAPASTGSITVSAPSSCTWTATSNAGWITITSGSSGSGNGIVSYLVAANTSTGPRSGNLAIADQSFTITQARTSYDINGDGFINALDLQILANVILGVTAGPGNCDINADGSVNALDLQLLINVIMASGF